jgi:hypothetical protein
MGVIDSTNPSSKRVAPLEHGVHPEGTSHEELQAASGTLGARVHPEGHVARRIASSEWHPWSTGCILKGTSLG